MPDGSMGIVASDQIIQSVIGPTGIVMVVSQPMSRLHRILHGSIEDTEFVYGLQNDMVRGADLCGGNFLELLFFPFFSYFF